MLEKAIPYMYYSLKWNRFFSLSKNWKNSLFKTELRELPLKYVRAGDIGYEKYREFNVDSRNVNMWRLLIPSSHTYFLDKWPIIVTFSLKGTASRNFSGPFLAGKCQYGPYIEPPLVFFNFSQAPSILYCSYFWRGAVSVKSYWLVNVRCRVLIYYNWMKADDTELFTDMKYAIFGKLCLQLINVSLIIHIERWVLEGNANQPMGGQHIGGVWVCATLLQFYTATERLKRICTSPQPVFQSTYFRKNTYVIIITTMIFNVSALNLLLFFSLYFLQQLVLYLKFSSYNSTITIILILELLEKVPIAAWSCRRVLY